MGTTIFQDKKMSAEFYNLYLYPQQLDHSFKLKRSFLTKVGLKNNYMKKNTLAVIVKLYSHFVGKIHPQK